MRVWPTLRKPLVGTLVALGLSIQAAALQPEDVLFMKAGPLTLRPQLSLSETYNDNIFYQGQNPVEDFITVVSPGLKLQLGRPEHNYISLGYTLDQLFYIRNPDLDAPQHTVDLADQFELQRLKLVGTDRFQLLSSPFGGVVERIIGTNGIATILGRDVNRTSFDDNYTLSYDLGEKTGLYVRATHSSTDYQQGIALYDIETLTGTFGFGYRAFPKTIFFGEGYYGQTTTEPNDVFLAPNPRLDFFGGYLGVRGNFTAKLSGMVKVGYESREFADGSSAPSAPVVDLALAQQFSETQSLSLTYSRQNNVSVQYSRENYTVDMIGLEFTQLMGPSRKWRATLGASYGMYGYEQAGSSANSVQYDYLRASANLAYQIQRWLTASIGYDFERVSGNSTAVIDYDVNRVTLRVAIGY
jgi:Putative beta-barrel porin 2